MADGEIVYKVKVDDSDAVSEARSAGQKMGEELSDKGREHSSTWGEIWKGAARQIGADIVNLGKQAAAALGNAIVDITKASVASYAEYDQLAGGAELMFGEAYDYVAEKAKNAYSTVQMSQNDYLQQVNGFATGLKNSMGGNAQAAAELADKIVTAEADIVAATGNSQENVQNAFNGIMKGNYTMLDNLQIGIKPTKEGMQEVIDKMNQWNAAQGKVTNYTIDNLADCEAAIVDYVSYVGMSGYASNEAADTIQGSLSMTKAAWQNLLTGLASGENVSGLIQNLIDSALNTFNLLLPRIKEALSGIVTLVRGVADAIIPMLPELVTTLLPEILAALGSIISAVLEVLPGVVGTLVTSLVSFLVENIPQLVNAGLELLVGLMDGIGNNTEEVIATILLIVTTLLNALIDHLPELITAGVTMLIAIMTGLMKAAPQILNALGQIIKNLLKSFKEVDWKSLGTALMNGIAQGISAGWTWLQETVKNVALGLLQTAKNLLGIHSPSTEFAFIGRMTTEGTVEGIEDTEAELTRTVNTVYGGMTDEAAKAINNAALSADLERNISANLTATAAMPETTITVPLYLDGRQIARATAYRMGEQLAWLEA